MKDFLAMKNALIKGKDMASFYFKIVLLASVNILIIISKELEDIMEKN